MSAVRDGGPAFPGGMYLERVAGDNNPYAVTSDGMTPRDYFAGQALAGMGTWAPGSDPQNAAAKARFAFQVADAMLAER